MRRLPKGQGLPGQANTSKVTQDQSGLLAQSPAPPRLGHKCHKCQACGIIFMVKDDYTDHAMYWHSDFTAS